MSSAAPLGTLARVLQESDSGCSGECDCFFQRSDSHNENNKGRQWLSTYVWGTRPDLMQYSRPVLLMGKQVSGLQG